MKRTAWLEVIGLWVGGLVVLFLSDLLTGGGGGKTARPAPLPAAFFLVVPVVWLRRRDRDPADAGIHAHRPLVALAWACLVALAVFPPYMVAYEVWSRWTSGERLHVPDHPLTYYEAAVRGRPPTGSLEPAVHVWVDGEWLFVLNATDSNVQMSIEGCGCPTASLALDQDGDLRATTRKGSCPDHGRAGPPISDPIRESPGQGRGVACSTSSSDRLILRAAGDAAWRLGSFASPGPSGPLVLDRSPWWLFEIILIHFVMVALPEEVFYRGFVQTTLAPLFRRRVRVLGASLGWHVVVASALFALSHLVTIPHPSRLAVFFPGLLFGWLRERTSGVLAPALLHAGSNVLLEFLVRFHGQ